MVQKCCVPGCRAEWCPSSVLSFHQFPKDPHLYKLWKGAVNKDKISAYAGICSQHFKQEDFELHYKRRRLKKNAVPVYLLPNSTEPPPRKELWVPTSCISKGSECYLEIPTLTSELPVTEPPPAQAQPRREVLVPTTCFSKGPNRYLEIPPLTPTSQQSSNNIQVPKVVRSVTKPQDADPLSLENEVMDAEEQTNSPPPLSPKAEYLEENSPVSSPEPKPAPMPMPTPLPMTTPVPMPTPTNTLNRLISNKKTIESLRRKARLLQQRLNRTQEKQEKMIEIIKSVKDYTKSSEIENILNGNFRKLCAAVNKNGVCVNYSDEVIKFAITVNYYSPKAYEFIRKYMSLPNTRMLQRYAETGTYIIDLDD